MISVVGRWRRSTEDCGTCRRVLGNRLRRGCVPSKEDARLERSYCGVLDDRSVRRGLL